MPSVLITGASRGLGLEFATQYARAGWRVFACARSASGLADLTALTTVGDVSAHVLDVTDFAAIDRLAQTLRGAAVDVLLNNAGVFGPNPWAGSDRGQVFEHIDYTMWAQVLRANTMAPLKMAEAFVEHVASSIEKKMIMISSTEGSISLTRGNLYAYKTSKAALNMVTRNLARDLEPRGIRVAALCPGWAKTRMGGVQAVVEVPDSVAGMRRMIAELTPERAGQFWRYNGESIPW
jgi:NAD(P)-dependent dehydrogenase (short-subunit alcohol dehydrogenase family)